MLIPDIGNLSGMKLIACDAAFAGLNNGRSEALNIICLVGFNDNYVPISWQSHRIKRVVKSTQATETFAMVDNLEVRTF